MIIKHVNEIARNSLVISPHNDVFHSKPQDDDAFILLKTHNPSHIIGFGQLFVFSRHNFTAVRRSDSSFLCQTLMAPFV